MGCQLFLYHINTDAQDESSYFNSRPCERGFFDNPELLEVGEYFNSRPCERGFNNLPYHGSLKSISIHAPAKGASYPAVHAVRKVENFNSRPCERGFVAGQEQFNEFLDFNSRPCERGFKSIADCTLTMQIFQFTPLRKGLR